MPSLKRAFIAAAALVAGSAALAQDANTFGPPAPETYRVLAAFKAVSALSGPAPNCTDPATCTDRVVHESTSIVSSVLISERTGAVIQCHFVKTAATPTQKERRGFKVPVIYIDAATPGAMGFADALRPALDENREELGSCLPYETQLTPAQRAGRANLPGEEANIGIGSSKDLTSGGGGYILIDPIRERRLESRYWAEKFNEKPASPLPLVRVDWVKSSFYQARLSGCDGAGDFSNAQRILDAHSSNKRVTDLLLRTNCPELQ